MSFFVIKYLDIYSMNYFVNAREYSDTQGGIYITYRLYSGSSEEEIKGMLLEDLKDNWIDTSDYIDRLENSPSLSLDEIASIFNEKLVDDAGYDYNLKIFTPYTNKDVAFDFYGDYKDDIVKFPDYEVGFYTYGDYAIRIQSLLGYLSSIRKDFKVSVPDYLINRLSNMMEII